MPDDDLFETEALRSRAEIAATLETVARQIEDGVVSVSGADGDHRLSLPERAGMEVELEREDAGYELELKLSWEV